MILSHLPFQLASATVADLRAVFERHAIMERAIEVPGCQSLYLAADDSDPSRAYVVGVWDGPEAYQRWLDHPGRDVGMDELNALLVDGGDTSPPGATWTVLHTTSSPPGAPDASPSERNLS